MDKLQFFDYQGVGVRTVVKDNEPWFVAKDVCEILEISNNRDAIGRLSASMKGVATTDTLGGNQRLTVISEAGVYKLVFTSRKPEAEKFTDWIASEVIPSIRKHGGYLTPEKIEEALLNPDTIIRLATDLKNERKKRIELENKAEEDKPKVLFADAVSVAPNSILIGDLAKLIQQNGINIGRDRLFDWMRKKGYLIKQQGQSYNTPTQKSMDLGLFQIKKTAITNADGSIRIVTTTKVTGKGQLYFVDKFLQQKAR